MKHREIKNESLKKGLLIIIMYMLTLCSVYCYSKSIFPSQDIWTAIYIHKSYIYYPFLNLQVTKEPQKILVTRYLQNIELMHVDQSIPFHVYIKNAKLMILMKSKLLTVSNN